MRACGNAAFLLLVATARVFAFSYHGDGEFLDAGPSTGFERYRLVLPAVNLCREGSYSYSVGELPREAFVVQIEYLYPSAISKEAATELLDSLSKNVIVNLSIFDVERNDAEMFSYRGELFQSGHDESGKYWRRGFPGIVDYHKHAIVFRIDGVLFHKGFIWQRHTKKRLLLAVAAPEPGLVQCFANVVITGGGWK